MKANLNNLKSLFPFFTKKNTALITNKRLVKTELVRTSNNILKIEVIDPEVVYHKLPSQEEEAKSIQAFISSRKRKFIDFIKTLPEGATYGCNRPTRASR